MGAVEGAPQRLQHADSHHGRVSVAGQVDEARDKAAEGVTAHEESDPPSLTHVQVAHGEVEELVGRDAQQVVAGKGLEDVRERAAVVTERVETGAVDDARNLAAEHGDLADALHVRGRRVEADEPALADNRACFVESLDADVVERNVAMESRPRLRLGEVEHERPASAPAHLGGHAGVAPRPL